MATLLLADIHLTDNARDEHRWGLLPWIKSLVAKNNIEHVLILGDLTDAKDRHSSFLVNQLSDQLADLSRAAEIIILKGNHDYIDENVPFFGFADYMRRVSFVAKPSLLSVAIGGRRREIALLPATADWHSWYGSTKDFAGLDYVFTHATFDGALSETGFKLEGVPHAPFAKVGKVWAGDIHVPQKVAANIEYVGAPYRTRFGDDFTPRVVLIDDKGKTHDLRFPCRDKHLVVMRRMVDLERAGRNISSGDQVKVRVRLKRAEFADWPALRTEIKEFAAHAKWELYGPEAVLLDIARASTESTETTAPRMSPEQVVKEYASRQKLDKVATNTGLSYIKDAKG